MDGLYAFKRGKFITEVRQEKASLGLITSHEGLDIMQFEVFPGKVMWIEPGAPDLMEYYYILDGSLTVLDDSGESRKFSAGDSFSVIGLKKQIPVHSKTGVRVLYLSTKPVFNYLCGFTCDLKELCQKVEEKDGYTKNHSRRVMEYSVKICEQLKLSEEITNTLAISSLFHDIGKCMIPDEILKKPGRLNPEELRFIFKHPVFSRSFVEGKFGKKVAEIVEQHHERLDGSGYPYGLESEDILPEAKIIAVADSFDAMTTKRVYKDAMSPAEALEELQSLAGSRYDAAAVEALGRYLREIHTI